MGHAFLRHASRTRLLVHVVDVAAANPERDYEVIREELEAHDPALLDKVTLVVANKTDLPESADQLDAFRRRRRKEGGQVVAMSARTGEGVADLMGALAKLLPDAATLAQPGPAAGMVVHRLDSSGDAFSVEREDGAFRVRGRRIERLANQTNFDNEESAERFQRDLAKLGIERELVRAGVSAGDTVRIGPVELEWSDEDGA